MSHKLHKLIFLTQLVLILIISIPVFLQVWIPVYRVTSDSMIPALKPGSLIFIEGRTLKSRKEWKGEVIVYFDPIKQQRIVHRVVGQEGSYLITKGDNNPKSDAFRPTAKDVIGRVYWP